MQNLFTRAKAAHQAEIDAANSRHSAHLEAKRVEVVNATILYAKANLDLELDGADLTLVPCREPGHPNVYGAARFCCDDLLFEFLPWSASWSVAASSDGTFHGFRDLAGLGEVLRHPDFAFLTQEGNEEGDE